jgi:hypothetical protein
MAGAKKDINVLHKHLVRLAKAWADKDTFEERHSKHKIIKFKYNGNAFNVVFPTTPSVSSIRKMYAQVRRNLKEVGLEAPPEFSMKLVGSVEQEESLEAIWNVLGEDD